MPSEKSARVALKKAGYNRQVKSATNTVVAATRRTIVAGDQEQSVAAVRRAASALDRAANGGVIHKNNASRRKSRLARSLQATDK
ncbi:MAG: 30S ribosomal protein S20 [Dehalococcoidia bacterium]|nr:30S ribosomal protein S20 [Dehalococcoidia bacterium]